MTNVNVQGLAAKAGLEGDTEALVHAVALDPLTASVLTLREIRGMVGEMLEAQRRWLPQFDGKSVRLTPAVRIPADVKPVDVPLDPALAIANRFGKLAQARP
jgi:alpha-galactosidase